MNDRAFKNLIKKSVKKFGHLYFELSEELYEPHTFPKNFTNDIEPIIKKNRSEKHKRFFGAAVSAAAVFAVAVIAVTVFQSSLSFKNNYTPELTSAAQNDMEIGFGTELEDSSDDKTKMENNIDNDLNSADTETTNNNINVKAYIKGKETALDKEAVKYICNITEDFIDDKNIKSSMPYENDAYDSVSEEIHICILPNNGKYINIGGNNYEEAEIFLSRSFGYVITESDGNKKYYELKGSEYDYDYILWITKYDDKDRT